MIVFDIETDGLLEEATKIYCMSYTHNGTILIVQDYEEMGSLFNSWETLIGHNVIRYDIPVAERILGIDLSGKLKIDTLALSWYLQPNRSKHGLEDYGVEFGYPKVKVDEDQWAEGNIDLMVERCNRDVEINYKLWQKQSKTLGELYA
jgi:hypothetical protein